MFDPKNPGDGSTPPERMMRITPLDMRQHHFNKRMNGYDRTEVIQFLTEAADDYEQALREIDRLRTDLTRMEALLAEHREREANLRNTLLTAQKLSDDIKETAHHEAKVILREAESRADLVLQQALGRLEEFERSINDLRLRRRNVEGSLEASIQALYSALEFIRDQDKADRDDKILLHRPRQSEAPAQAPASQPATDWKAGGQ